MSFHRQRVRTSSLLSEGLILPMVSSHSFGSYVCDKALRSRVNALLGLGFPTSSPKYLGVKQTTNVNSLTHSSIGTTLLALRARISNLQFSIYKFISKLVNWSLKILVRRTSSVCLLANDFSFYFTPISGFFSPFPHGTSSLSVSLSI